MKRVMNYEILPYYVTVIMLHAPALAKELKADQEYCLYYNRNFNGV